MGDELTRGTLLPSSEADERLRVQAGEIRKRDDLAKSGNHFTFTLGVWRWTDAKSRGHFACKGAPSKVGTDTEKMKSQSGPGVK